MQQHIWKIRKQLLIPFVLLELLAIATSTGANVIRKEFTVVEPTTEGSAETTTLEQTALPVQTITSPAIAKITSNDILRENQRSPESTTLFESQTTEGNVEILKAAQETTAKVAAKLLDADDSKITTNSSNEETTAATTTTNSPNEETTAATTEIPTTKENANSEGENERREISSDKVATTDVATESVPITTESEEFDIRTRVRLDDDTTKRIQESNQPHSNESILLKADEFKTQTTEFSQETTDEPTTGSAQLLSNLSTPSITRSTSSTSHSTSSTTRSTSLTSKAEENVPKITTESTIVNNKLITATESEKNSSVTANEVVVEGTSYDITTNEIRNLSSIRTTEKRPKQIKNMTLPDAPEVWALAGMRKSDKTKDKDQKFVNITDENALDSASSTTATKILSDWSKIMNEVELNTNHAQNNPNSIENTLESSVNKPETSEAKLQVQKVENDNNINSPSSVVSNSSTEIPPTSKPIAPTTKATYDETTPSIEKNQIIEADKKIKETDSTVGVGGRKEINTTIPPLTTAVINILKKITSTTPTITRQTIGILTEKPLHIEDVEKRKHFSTSSQLANLIDSSPVTTSSPSKKVIDETTLATIQSSTKANWFQNETTTVQKILVTTDTVSDDISTTNESSTTSTDYSTSTETFTDTSSGSSSYLPQMTSESIITTEDSDTSSSTTSEFSQTSTTISTQLKPTLANNIRTSPASEDYSTWTPSNEAPPVSTTRASPTSEQPTENNVIDRITEDATIGLDQFTSETSKMSTTTFISSPSSFDDSVKSINATEEISTTTTVFQNTPGGDDLEVYSDTPKNINIPVMPTTTATKSEIEVTTSTTESSEVGGPIPPDNSNTASDTDYNVIIAISVSVVGILALILLVGFLYVMRKRQKSLTYGQRCRPVSLDAYSLDNVSIYNSVRRKGALRASKRSYGNVAFDDPSLKHNILGIHDLAKFVDRKTTIHEEFKDVPQITTRADEVPPGCEDKNRYANVIPLPETRVILKQVNEDEKSEYINANFVRGPKDPPNYYIACQAPLESTVADFWRMIWEQNSRVIIMATDLVENGKEKCVEYLPPSITIDNHVVFGDFQITLKNREVKEKYAVSTLHVKNNITNTWREITHFWYQWPESGVPGDEAGVIAMLLEARSCLKMPIQEQIDEEELKTNGNLPEPNGNIDKTKSLSKTQGPLTVHCSPGTGRTGTIIACDIALRSLETPKRTIDIPQIVYYVRRGRASAVLTKEQYEFIYRVAHMYATKISGPVAET